MSDDHSVHSAESGGKRIPEKKKNQASDKPDTEPQRAETPRPIISPETNLPPSEPHQCKKRYKCIKEEVKFWFEVGGYSWRLDRALSDLAAISGHDQGD